MHVLPALPSVAGAAHPLAMVATMASSNKSELKGNPQGGRVTTPSNVTNPKKLHYDIIATDDPLPYTDLNETAASAGCLGIGKMIPTCSSNNSEKVD